MPNGPAAIELRKVQRRHGVAEWLAGISLAGRLSWLVALIVTTVVAGAAFVEEQSFARSVERDLMDTVESTARAVAADLAARPGPLDPSDIRDTLHDFAAADPVVHAISFVEREDGQAQVLASTSTEERAETVELASRAIATNADTSEGFDTYVVFAVPIRDQSPDAVVVTVGTESLHRVRSRGTWIAFGLALPTVFLVTMLVNLAIRRFVHRPIASILGTMEHAARGDLTARASTGTRDEFGTIADGLNAMLGRLEQFNEVLQERIREATSDLSVRNAELAASYGQTLALREALARSERMAALGQMAANVAHQAGTPLNLISGYVQMLRDDPYTDARVRTRLQTIDGQIQQVTRVLRSMLDHARQPAGFDYTDLAGIIERVREVAAPGLTRSHIQLRVSVPEGLPPIWADATQLEMAILNLVINALDAMPEGGLLSIVVEPSGQGVRIKVADTGGGIAPSVVDHIFEPWVTTKPAGRGTGLGLAIVRDVVKGHGGSVAAHSEPERGTVFVIELPRHDTASEAVASS